MIEYRITNELITNHFGPRLNSLTINACVIVLIFDKLKNESRVNE